MRRKKCILLIIIFSFLFIPTLTVNAAKAKTLAELRGELSNLKNQKTANQTNKNQTQSQINSTKNDIASMHTEIMNNQQTIVETQEESRQLEKEIESGKVELSTLMKYYQILDSDNIYLKYVFEAKDYEDLIYRYSLVEQIIDYTDGLINNWKEKIAYNAQLKIDLEQREIELNSQISSLNKSLNSLGNKLTQLNDMALDIDAEIKSVQNSINYYVSIGCKENELLTSCLSVYGDTGFRRPLVSGTITSEFGYRTHPVTGAVKSFHSGTDIGVREGTKVYAIANGTVSKLVVRSNCGGNAVYVQHIINGKKYTSTYMHLLTMNVKVGDKVTNETVVGLSGGDTTGYKKGGYDQCTTGGHLHLSLATDWYGSDYVAYNSWISHLIDPRKNMSLPNSWTSR